jgi:hypothetical protein
MAGAASENAEPIQWLLNDYQKYLTTWELDFLDNIQDLAGLSPKQQAALDKIWREVVVERRRERS